jgi:hypothetical protein
MKKEFIVIGNGEVEEKDYDELDEDAQDFFDQVEIENIKERRKYK